MIEIAIKNAKSLKTSPPAVAAEGCVGTAAAAGASPATSVVIDSSQQQRERRAIDRRRRETVSLLSIISSQPLSAGFQ